MSVLSALAGRFYRRPSENSMRLVAVTQRTNGKNHHRNYWRSGASCSARLQRSDGNLVGNGLLGKSDRRRTQPVPLWMFSMCWPVWLREGRDASARWKSLLGTVQHRVAALKFALLRVY